MKRVVDFYETLEDCPTFAALRILRTRMATDVLNSPEGACVAIVRVGNKATELDESFMRSLAGRQTFVILRGETTGEQKRVSDRGR